MNESQKWTVARLRNKVIDLETTESHRECASDLQEALDLIEQQVARITELETKCRLYEASLDKADAEADGLRAKVLELDCKIFFAEGRIEQLESRPMGWVWCDTIYEEHCHSTDEEAIEEGWRPLVCSDLYEDIAKDAARYRRIRLGLSDRHGDVYAMIFAADGDYPEDGDELDVAVDRVIAASAKGEQT